jgi:hypothetical protein
VEIRSVRLLEKTGGKSGDWRREAEAPAARPARRPGARAAGRIGGRPTRRRDG